MEVRNASGAWAGPDQGWTEGDMWIYTFDVIQDVPGVIALKSGNKSFVEFLDDHFDGAHNQHTNEASGLSRVVKDDPLKCKYDKSSRHTISYTYTP